ncbi:MAG: hypothetical protein J6U68_01755, partial [Clostridia bacterium]|nr:hypothetical protein [Clostridia bacterium]
MFKSVFSKYVTAFMLIILVSFLVVFIITASAIGRFSNVLKEEVVKNTTETARTYFSSLLYSSQVENLYELDDREKAEATRMLDNISLNVEDVSTIVTDLDGKIVFSYFSENNEMAFEGGLPSDVVDNVVSASDENYFATGEFTGIFEGANALGGSAIENREGKVCGYVFSCSDALMMADLWELLFKIIMGSIFWVLLAALIAVYFISERVVAPLRDISNA